MTGIVTAFWISWIFFTGDIRATPPSRRMSEGTRSSAMTDAAPASSAILACSALVTSMMTPPLSISARPMCLRSAIRSPFSSAMFCLLFLCAPRPAGPQPRDGLRRARPLLCAKTRQLDHGHRRALHPFPATKPGARGLDRFGEAPDSLVDSARRHRREREPQCTLTAAVHEEGCAGREGDASLDRLRQERACVHPRRQGDEQR